MILADALSYAKKYDPELVIAVDGLHRVVSALDGGGPETEKSRDAGAVDVDVEQPDLVAGVGQSGRDVHRGRRLADPAGVGEEERVPDPALLDREFRLAACAPGVRLEYGPMPHAALTAADFGDAEESGLLVSMYVVEQTDLATPVVEAIGSEARSRFTGRIREVKVQVN